MQPDCAHPNPLAAVPHQHVAVPRGLAGQHAHPHHIIGRIRRHGTARHLAMRHAVSQSGGCTRVAAPIHAAGVLKRPLSSGIVAKLTQLVAGGSGVIGGFGVFGGQSLVPTISPACTGAACDPHTPVSEPVSILLLGFAALLVMMLRGRFVRKAVCS